jgi:hypothetical protein
MLATQCPFSVVLLTVALGAVACAIYTVSTKTDIAVGHQSGDDLHDEVYLSIYDVGGAKSDYHAVARIAITRMDC